MNYRLFLPLLLLCSTFSTHAQQRWFEVELLLFQRNVDIKDIKEDLATDNISVDTKNSISLFKAGRNKLCAAGSPCLHESNPVLINSALFDSNANGFQLLDASHLQLTAQRKKLASHAAFTPVLHLAWRMPVSSKRSAIPLHLFAGKNFALSMPENTWSQSVKSANSGKTANESMNNNEDEQDLLSNIDVLTDKWAIDGNLKIYVDHYLFIDSQLVIRREVAQQVTPLKTVQEPEFEVIDSENNVQVINQTRVQKAVESQQETVIKEILFDQNRRLRSEEIHYFDHPLIGMIVQIRKI